MSITIQQSKIPALRVNFINPCDLSEERKEFLHSTISSLAKQLGIRKEININFKKDFMSSSSSGISIEKKFDSLPEGTQEFFLAHELAHIKNNDQNNCMLYRGKIALISLISAVSISFIATYSFLISPAFGFVIGINVFTGSLANYLYVVENWIAQGNEKHADKDAASVCSLKAVQQFKDFCKCMSELNIQLYNFNLDSSLAQIIDNAVSKDCTEENKIKFKNYFSEYSKLIYHRKKIGASEKCMYQKFFQLLISTPLLFLTHKFFQLLITKTGDNRFDFRHPSLLNRIAYLGD
jgi:hypothetical protein